VIADSFRVDLRCWAENDRKLMPKLLDLVEAVVPDPFKGVGKPEPLKHELAGAWSRRLTHEHRIVYSICEDRIEFLQARYITKVWSSLTSAEPKLWEDRALRSRNVACRFPVRER
jgi:toxin YoeB